MPKIGNAGLRQTTQAPAKIQTIKVRDKLSESVGIKGTKALIPRMISEEKDLEKDPPS